MKAICILHGWAYSTEKWKPFVNLLKKRGFKAKLLKIPGLTKPLNKPWTLGNYNDWLEQELSKQTSKVMLIGYSNGGRIALSFAAKYPDKLSKLILIDSAGIRRKELRHRLKRAVFRTVAKTGKKLTKSEYLRRLLYKIARESDYKQASPVMRQTMKNLISTDLQPVLSQITTPTTIIWGENDNITPLSDARVMHRLIKHSQLKVIKGARHAPQFTHAGKVAELISS